MHGAQCCSMPSVHTLMRRGAHLEDRSGLPSCPSSSAALRCRNVSLLIRLTKPLGVSGSEDAVGVMEDGVPVAAPAARALLVPAGCDCCGSCCGGGGEGDQH